MAWEPSLGGFYAPVCLLVLVMSVCFLRTYIQLKRHPERKYELRVLSEEQQKLSSCESNQHCHSDTGGSSGPATNCTLFATNVSVLANEHSFKSQLRAAAFTLFLFLATWALGALAVSQGQFLDMIFSCLYGAFCVTLGLFLLIQHCAKRDDVWHCWWACWASESNTKDGNGDGQSQNQDLHQPQCHLSSPCTGKQPMLSPHLVQGSCHKMTQPPQSPTTNHAGPCFATLDPVSQNPIPPLTELLPSVHPQSLSDELPRPTLPLQSCFANRIKSRSFSRPRPCLQDYRCHITSTSMDGSVHSSHLESPLVAHHLEASPLVSSSPHPDIQLPCPNSHLDKDLVTCSNLQRQTSCHSVQDSMTSCHGHANNMHDSISSCHSLLLPSCGSHTFQWHTYASADHSSTRSCCDKPLNPFTLQHQQDLESYPSMSKTTDADKVTLCMEQQGFPRNTLPRQHAAVSRRNTIGRNRSLQEDGLFGSDTIGNIRTGPWKNETTV